MLSAGLMTIDKGSVAIASVLSVTWKVTELGPPAVVGMPEMTPTELSDNPAGSVPDVNAQI